MVKTINGMNLNDGDAYWVDKNPRIKGTYIWYENKEKFRKLNGLNETDNWISFQILSDLVEEGKATIHLLK